MSLCRRFCLVVFVLSFANACTPVIFVRDLHTPEATFQTWKQAVENLDLDQVIACYADEAKADLRQEIGSNTSEGLKSMQDETKSTVFSIEKVVYRGTKAFVRVDRKRDNDSDVEVLTMIKENGEWRLLP